MEEKFEPRLTIVEFHFTDGTGFALTDRMRNAHVKLNPVDKEGVDAIDVDFKYLKEAFKRKTKVKDLLMDQNIIRGIGNGYSNRFCGRPEFPLTLLQMQFQMTKLSRLVVMSFMVSCYGYNVDCQQHERRSS